MSEPLNQETRLSVTAQSIQSSAEAPGRKPWRRYVAAVLAYFRDQDPTFKVALPAALIVAALLFVRSPLSNYIFDEQEALLANPYVNGSNLGFFDAFRRDFWGLPPGRSIGSYRPIPNMIWRTLWLVSESPWLLHWLNVAIHALNAALVASLTLSLTQSRLASWLAGAAFVTAAVLTEAVTGVVGLADVLAGLATLLALSALRCRLLLMPVLVFLAILLGLFSKESVLVAIPLLGWVALVAAPAWHPPRPQRLCRALLAIMASIAALVLYTHLRRHFFPVTLPDALREPLPDSEPLYRRALHEFLRWFQQPRLPDDPINNPLSGADTPHRIAGALRVYLRGLTQVVFPWRLSGDYSYPQEPVPDRLVFPSSVLGALALAIPPILGVGVWLRALFAERSCALQQPTVIVQQVDQWRYLLPTAIALVWVPLAYFPHSNILVVLPTVRAERFWYLPVIGSSLLVAALLRRLIASTSKRRLKLMVPLVVVFFVFQAVKARAHAFDYMNDLVFWKNTSKAAPNSAKAHLNYSVMVGARGLLQERLEINRRALDLAPQWAMAHIYYGDTLCRLRRPSEAWPHYRRGFELAPNDANLIGLALQCLWDQKGLSEPRQQELLDLAEEHEGSWLAYFATEIVTNGEKHGGIEKKYRPRGYNEGPKHR